ncbi:hypothetical protein ACFLS1_09800 [Verrucomicrobiota bacterium]
MSLLSAGLIVLFNIGLLETVETTDASNAFLAAETGLSLGKAYCRSNAAWTANVPVTLASPIGRGQYFALVEFSSVVTQITTQTVWVGDEPLTWSSGVMDGYQAQRNWTLSDQADLINNIRDNDGDALDFDNYAQRGATIANHNWYSVYFTNNFPTNATNINSAKIYIDLQGPAGVTGEFEVAVSADKDVSQWYLGVDGTADATSGNESWNGDNGEQRYTNDLTSILDTYDKINNCEILILNYNDSAKSASKGRLYFDYIFMDAVYEMPPTPLTIVTTSIFPQVIISSTGLVNQTKWSSRWSGAGATIWRSGVIDGYHARDNRKLSSRPVGWYLRDIQDDDGDAVSDGDNYAERGDTFADHMWYSVYFSDNFPEAARGINSVKVYIDHQGAASQNGALVVHASTNRNNSQWYQGNTGTSDTNSGDVAWSDTEQRYTNDLTSVLDTPEKINNCEILILNRDSSSHRDVYFDYIYIEVDYW